MNMDRHDFLKGAAGLSLLAAAGGCSSVRFGFGAGAPMAGFAVPPLKRVRVAFVGVGGRGTYALKRLSQFPGVDVVAICDNRECQLKINREFLAEKKLPPAKEFLGDKAYKDLCQWDGVDVVYAATPWELHAPVGLAAMRGGKHAFLEVPATMTTDDCWELVETSEATRRHCMMLENCCYGENEMLALNLCRLGVLGETVYGEAGYLHSGKGRSIANGPTWRSAWYETHCGNIYPTHGLGPVAQYMNVNRGDRFDYLVSVDSKAAGAHAYGKAKFPADSWQANVKFKLADWNASIIKTVGGQTIYLATSMHVPHPYSRINTIQGTKGIFMDYPLRISFEKEYGDGLGETNFTEELTQKYRELYKHPMWKQVGEIAKKVGGHGGMDFIMDLRWVYCLQNGLPLDMDVYDLASWSCICELTEKSCNARGKPVDIPDFTRGAWKTMKPLGIESVDLEKMRFEGIGDIGKQQTV